LVSHCGDYSTVNHSFYPPERVRLLVQDFDSPYKRSGKHCDDFVTDYQLNQNCLMLRWSVIFFIIAIVAAIFGFGGIAEGAASIAKVLFFIFLVLFVITILFGATLFKK
jgi:uncharacterized membrane protein YtjA (UPF0391 family)